MPSTRAGLVPSTVASPVAERPVLAGALALLVHLVFLALMVFALRWQTTPSPVVAELWDALPGPESAPPLPEARLAPEPPRPAPPTAAPQSPPPPRAKPAPEPVAKQPSPPAAKPDIALEKAAEKRMAEDRRRAETEARRQRESAEAAQREEDARREAEAAKAAEQARQREAEAARLAQEAEQQRQRELQRQQQVSQQARAAALDLYRSQIMRAVRARLVEPPGIQGNPQAEVKVLQLPSGEVVQARVTRSSGIPAYDEAVERAVLAASPLPLPPDRSLFARDFTILFRLRE